MSLGSVMQLVDRSPRRIVVLRANGLGDFLMATPALRALGKGLPEAHITYLALPWLRDFRRPLPVSASGGGYPPLSGNAPA